MTTTAFLWNVATMVALMAAAAAIEVFLPLFERGEASQGRAKANLSLIGVTLGVNWALTSLTAIVALKLRPVALLHKLPSAVQILITVLVLDFMYGYLSHVLLHKIPIMWRVHQVHHSDPFVDVTTSLRQHPLEGMWRFVFMTIPAWMLGLPAAGIVVYRLISRVNGVLEHANIRLWRPLDRVGSLVWCTPNMHKVHHSNNPVETDSNYGNIFSVYDRVFGTFTNTDRARQVVYGLKETDVAQVRSFTGLLRRPFAGGPKTPRNSQEVELEYLLPETQRPD
jgi:sterol desaturase/sphingolipid hydroxylase (fatty acid hydroxylase superfamily)